MKNFFSAAIGVIGGWVSSLLGGWSAGLTTLVIFMVIDYITGLVVAGVFHNSPKSQSGALESRAGLKGLFRKMVMLAFVLIAYRLDLAAGTSYIRDGACIAFIVNEVISIVENAGLMGIPIPSIITKAIDLLNDKTGDKSDDVSS